MSYKITRFKLEHLDLIEPRESAQADFDFIKQDERQKVIYTQGAIFNTLWYNETPIMVYGFYNDGMGTYTIMVIASKYMSRHKFATIRALYKYYEDYVFSDIRRFEAFVNLDDQIALNFAKFFGFSVIGIRHNASISGADQAILERLHRKGGM